MLLVLPTEKLVPLANPASAPKSATDNSWLESKGALENIC